MIYEAFIIATAIRFIYLLIDKQRDRNFCKKENKEANERYLRLQGAKRKIVIKFPKKKPS